MRLSELDKSKLPVKMYNNFFCNIWDILFVGDKHSVGRQEEKESWFDSNSDSWSPYQEPKQKVALYMYKHEGDTRWTLRDIFFKDDKDFKYSRLCHEGTEFKRLMWSEVEL